MKYYNYGKYSQKDIFRYITKRLYKCYRSSKTLPEREYPMNNKKIIAIMMTLSMLAAAFAGCLGGDDDEPEPEAVMGCMDATANNYDATATEDDGSCTYIQHGH